MYRKSNEMGRSYKPLRVALAKLYLELKDLDKLVGINFRTRKKIELDQPVDSKVLEKIIDFLRSRGLKADFNDVVVYVDDDNSKSPDQITEDKKEI